MDVKKTVTLILVDGIYKPVVPKKCTPEQQQDQQVPVPEPKCDSEEKKRKIEYTEEKEKGKEIGLPQSECKSPEKKKRKIEEEKEEYKQVEVDQLKSNSTPKKRKIEKIYHITEQITKEIEVIVISDSDSEPQENTQEDKQEDSLLQQVQDLEETLIKQENDQELPTLPDIKYKSIPSRKCSTNHDKKMCKQVQVHMQNAISTPPPLLRCSTNHGKKCVNKSKFMQNAISNSPPLPPPWRMQREA